MSAAELGFVFGVGVGLVVGALITATLLMWRIGILERENRELRELPPERLFRAMPSDDDEEDMSPL